MNISPLTQITNQIIQISSFSELVNLVTCGQSNSTDRLLNTRSVGLVWSQIPPYNLHILPFSNIPNKGLAEGFLVQFLWVIFTQPIALNLSISMYWVIPCAMHYVRGWECHGSLNHRPQTLFLVSRSLQSRGVKEALMK